jgi:hypothetical protein
MVAWSQRPRFALVGDGRRILPGKNIQGFLVKAEPHVLGCNVQHSVCIVGEMGEIGSVEFLSKKIAEGKSGQPILHERARLLAQAGGILYGNQFLPDTKALGSAREGFRKMTSGAA